ncbi:MULTISPECIES: endonuclease/exonuclease/phosphatase family protein [Acidiphilium]|uniref:Metal-dependent hydrolase, endonuclease/exonuclease/phosphatase family n=1 Tax=Acidiphilium rubrum TaxID=526 RepID=A0A8G2CL01_ACIRU|nr:MULTISPECIES: endonuclease/exonuclease/phosphatase family protein [Acidiphilium]SIQ89990.1 Metal-dependent hydrolase, endonuclease/exonuclease/phosphatase family [Acidiphilium rubrum]
MRVISWNLLHRVGAEPRDVAALIEAFQPDLLLMQEATEGMAALRSLCGGWYFRAPFPGRRYGVAAWSRHCFAEPALLRLPASVIPGRVPPRLAQLIRMDGMTIANVHLSHGQVLNRLQLRYISRHVAGPAAIIGDYNAVGPIRLSGFRDIGPRQTTCRASSVIPFRLDRCMVRAVHGTETGVLRRGMSDHHPIRIRLTLDTIAQPADPAPIPLARESLSRP